MKRTNTFVVRPRKEEHEELLYQLLDASASLWNELNYERRQQFFDGESVWNTTGFRKQYAGVLGSSTAQQVIRKNSEAWRPFFAAQEEGRELRTFIRNDQYMLETGERSRLEISLGQDLKDEYGIGSHNRLHLEVAGDPKWEGKQGRLELFYDEIDETFRANQPVTVSDSRQDSPLADEAAALDVGANNLSPVRPPPASGTCTKAATCLPASTRPPRKLLAYSRNYPMDERAVNGFGGCIASGHAVETTLRTPSFEI